MAGVAFPYFDPESMANGKRRIYVRIRRDHPEVEDGRTKKKYVAPYGDRKHLYFPPRPELFADTEVPIVLVEAEKSVLALLAWSDRTGRKILPLATGGDWGWRAQIGIKDTADGERVPEVGAINDLNICRDGRRTYVLLDANCATNSKVMAARKALVQQLQKQKAEVRVMDLPVDKGVNGPDDYIAAKGDEALARLFETRTSVSADAITVKDVSTGVRPDMPQEVLDGRLGEICQRRLARSPLAFAWPAIVTAAGTLIPRQQQAIRSNLYCALVGPVDTGKTQTLTNAVQLMGLKAPQLIEGKYGSAEGLIDALQDIEPHAIRLYSVDELRHLLDKCAIDRSSFPTILNTAYYHDYQQGGTKKAKFIFDCRLSLTGGLVEDQFGDAFGIASVGGFYDRFVFGLCPQPFEYLYRPFEGSAEPVEPVGALVDPEVWEARDQMIAEGIRGRVAEQAIKFAYICASVDARPTLRAQDLGSAIAFARYQMNVRQLLLPNPGENPDARCAFAIRKWLNTNAPNGEWVRRHALDRGIHSSRLGPGVFNRCLQNLQFNDEIELDLKNKILRLLVDGQTNSEIGARWTN